jgi:flavorubredoxin
MDTRATEIAHGIHQLTTYVESADFSFNQYLVSGDEPLLFHMGLRQIFPLVSGAAARIAPLEGVRWISCGHVEADECGSMNEWLAVSPRATVVQGQVGCMVSLNDLADREPRPLADGETLDIGGHVLRWIDTPHVPHAWEAGLLYDETTRTLLCGDLFTQTGSYDATTTDDIVGPAIAGEDLFRASSLAPSSASTVRRLAELDILTLALMHGPAFTGNCKEALHALANDYDRRVHAVAETSE